jgi:hypothetical protein
MIESFPSSSPHFHITNALPFPLHLSLFPLHNLAGSVRNFTSSPNTIFQYISFVSLCKIAKYLMLHQGSYHRLLAMHMLSFMTFFFPWALF